MIDGCADSDDVGKVFDISESKRELTKARRTGETGFEHDVMAIASVGFAA